MTDHENVWLYAVVPAGRQPPEVSGVAGESLRVIAGDGVDAVAGSVPRAEFDEEPLQANLENAVWLERAVRVHHRAVAAVDRSGPALPLRFATLYRDDDRVAAMLRARRSDLLAALERVSGRAEWGVKLYVAPAAASGGDGTTGGATAGTAGGTAEEPRPGTAYLRRRKAHLEDREEALRQATAAGQQIHTALAAAAAESTQHPLHGAEASGRSEPMVLNGAYLIDDSGRAAFDTAVDALMARHPGLRLEMTGPWPPYSFSGVAARPTET